MLCTKFTVFSVFLGAVLCDEVLTKQKRDLVKDEGSNNHHYGYGLNSAHVNHHLHEHEPNHHQQRYDFSNTEQNHFQPNPEEESHSQHHNHKIKTIKVTKNVPVPYEVIVEKRVPYKIEVPVDKPYNVYIPKPYPIYVEKRVPYKVEIPVPKPYTVEKKVPVPVKVPVDKPYPVYIPKPYKVYVEKKVPYILEKHVPYTVKVPVEKPYPVHVKVEKEIPYKVEKVVPYPVKVPVEKFVPVHVEKPVAVKIEKLVPYPVEKLVPYPVKVPVKIPVNVPFFIESHRSNQGNLKSGSETSYSGSTHSFSGGDSASESGHDGSSLDVGNSGHIYEFGNSHNVGGISEGASADQHYGLKSGFDGGIGSVGGHSYELDNGHYVGGSSEGAGSVQHYGLENGHHINSDVENIGHSHGTEIDYNAGSITDGAKFGNLYGITTYGASSSYLFGYENRQYGGSYSDEGNTGNLYGFDSRPEVERTSYKGNPFHSYGFLSENNGGSGSNSGHSYQHGENFGHSYGFGSNEQSAGSNLDQSMEGSSHEGNSGESYNSESSKHRINVITDGKSSVQSYGRESHAEDSLSAGSGDTSGNVHHYRERNESDSNNGKSSNLKRNKQNQAGNPNEGSTYISNESEENSFYPTEKAHYNNDHEKINWGTIATNGTSSYSYVSGSHLAGRYYSKGETIKPKTVKRTISEEIKNQNVTKDETAPLRAQNLRADR